MGRKKTLGLSGGPAKQKYKCKVCDVHPRGCDLQRHYKLNTNWERMEELQACIGDEALSRRKGDTDKHTLFMFENNYNMEKMPTYQTQALWHVQDDVEDDDQEDGETSSKRARLSITSFFSKLNCICYWGLYINDIS